MSSREVCSTGGFEAFFVPLNFDGFDKESPLGLGLQSPNPSPVQSPELNYDEMAVDDGYDPAKAEFITPATEEQEAQAKAELLKQQIVKLEKSLEKNGKGRFSRHYERVLAEMRSEACVRSKEHTHARRRSDPAGLVMARKEPLSEMSTNPLSRSASAFACFVKPPPNNDKLLKSHENPLTADATPPHIPRSSRLQIPEGVQLRGQVRNAPHPSVTRPQSVPEKHFLSPPRPSQCVPPKHVLSSPGPRLAVPPGPESRPFPQAARSAAPQVTLRTLVGCAGQLQQHNFVNMSAGYVSLPSTRFHHITTVSGQATLGHVPQMVRV